MITYKARLIYSIDHHVNNLIKHIFSCTVLAKQADKHISSSLVTMETKPVVHAEIQRIQQLGQVQLHNCI